MDKRPGRKWISPLRRIDRYSNELVCYFRMVKEHVVSCIHHIRDTNWVKKQKKGGINIMEQKRSSHQYEYFIETRGLVLGSFTCEVISVSPGCVRRPDVGNEEQTSIRCWMLRPLPSR